MQDAATFFGTPFLPEPQVPAEILTTQEANDMTNDDHARLVNLLNVAMIRPANAGHESAVVDFAVELFKLVDNADIGRMPCEGRYLHYRRFAQQYPSPCPRRQTLSRVGRHFC
jgi:hypothetical protein